MQKKKNQVRVVKIWSLNTSHRKTRVCTPPDVTTCTEQALLHEATGKDLVTPPWLLMIGLLCGSNSKGLEPGTTCERQKQTISRHGWRACL